MARNSNEQTLGELIDKVIKTYGLETRITREKIAGVWEKVMGSFIASKTEKITLQKDTLIVELNSSALCNELNYAKEKIIESINKEFGKNVIKKIIIR